MLFLCQSYKDTVQNLGPLATSPVFYFLLGSASFRFHMSPSGATPAHFFDILFGFLFVTHLALVAASASAYLLLHRRAAPYVAPLHILHLICGFLEDMYSEVIASYSSVATSSDVSSDTCDFDSQEAETLDHSFGRVGRVTDGGRCSGMPRRTTRFEIAESWRRI